MCCRPPPSDCRAVSGSVACAKLKACRTTTTSPMLCGVASRESWSVSIEAAPHTADFILMEAAYFAQKSTGADRPHLAGFLCSASRQGLLLWPTFQQPCQRRCHPPALSPLLGCRGGRPSQLASSPALPG